MVKVIWNLWPERILEGRERVEEGKTLPMEEVIGLTNRIVLGGVNGFFRQ